MGFVLFYYTLFVMLASILASATCLSAYLVSHRREMMFAVFGFLFYFFDVAWVLQDDFALLGDLQVVGVFVIVRSLVSVVTGGGCLMAFWLLLCDYLGRARTARCAWCRGWCTCWAASRALTLLPDGNVQRFVFYTTRAMLLFWMLLYVGFRYFSSKDEVERNRLRLSSMALRAGVGGGAAHGPGGRELLLGVRAGTPSSCGRARSCPSATSWRTC